MACGKAVQFLNYARLSYHSVGVCLTEREMKKHIYILYTQALTDILTCTLTYIHIYTQALTYSHTCIPMHLHTY